MEAGGIHAHAVRRPTKAALVCDDRRVSYGELDLRAIRSSGALRRLGIGAGDRVAIALRNRPEFFEAMEAVGRLGAAVVPVAWRAAADEMRYLVEDSQAKLILAEDDAGERVGGLAALALGDYRAALEREPAEPHADVPDPVLPTVVAYTSGTTGRPKAIEITAAPPSSGPASPVLTGIPFLTFWGLDAANEVHLCCGPLYHSQPRGFALFALLAGHTVALMHRFDAEECLRLIERERVTWTSMAPVHFARILALPDDVRARYDLSSLRFVLHSAAPCPVEVKRRIMDLFPEGAVWEVYGGTEGLFTMISPEEWRRKPGSVGRAAPGVTLKVLDESGSEVPPGEIGIVYASSISGARFGYRGAPEVTAETWRGSLFTLGELGRLDDDGYLFLTDRMKDMIVTGGANVYSAEIEAVLHAHPSIADVAVIGVPDDEFGEQVKALVEIASPVTAEEVIAFCRERLAGYKCPKTVEFVERLPRDPNGKIRKRELREPYWAGRGRRI